MTTSEPRGAFDSEPFRASATTRWPRSSRTGIACRPRYPVEPATKTVSGMIDGRRRTAQDSLRERGRAWILECRLRSGLRVPNAYMRIAIIAPPFIPVPPVAYGGTELFVAHLAEGLQSRGQDVVVYANGESRVGCQVQWPYRRGEWATSPAIAR